VTEVPPPDPALPVSGLLGPPSQGIVASGAGAVAASNIEGPVAGSGGFAAGRDIHVHQAPSGPAKPWDSVSAFHLRGRRHRTNFLGRDKDLAKLSELLAGESPPPAVIVGMGGVGKSQLAVEYAGRHRNEHRLTWMINADTIASLAEQYARLADSAALGLPAAAEPDLSVRIDAVTTALSNNAGWLLVVDNVDSTEVQAYLTSFLPDTGAGGRVIVTSRIPDWSGDFAVMRLAPLESEASATFLASLIEGPTGAAVHDLAEELAGLPLALEQAAAFCQQTGRDYSYYLTQFRASAEKMIGQGGLAGQRTVATTYSLSISRVREIDAGAAALLDLLAYFAPDVIPRFVLEVEETADGEEDTVVQGPKTEQAGSAIEENDPLEPLYQLDDLDAAVATLRRFSLLDPTPDGLSVHRLLQAAVRGTHEQEVHAAFAAFAGGQIWGALPQLEPASWPTYERLTPHALAVARHLETIDGQTRLAIDLLTIVGMYQRDRGLYVGARAPLQQALRLAEKEYGADDIRLLEPLNALSMALAEWPQESLSYDRRAVAIAEAAYGPEHLEVFRPANNLGSTLLQLGYPGAARPVLERALRIAETTVGADQTQVGAATNNLGETLRQLGDAGAARPLFERALRIAETTYGPDDAEVFLPANNLGGALLQLGDPAAARPLFERALRIAEATYGADHAQVFLPDNNLGNALFQLGDPEAARPLFERALRIAETTYGPDHAQVLLPANNLAETLRQLGDPGASRPLFERALQIAETTYGPDHAQVQTLASNLGGALLQLGDPGAARPLFERALRIAETTYGPDHVQVLLPANNLGETLRQLGDLEAARPLFERALRIAETRYGDRDRRLIPMLSVLGRVLVEAGQAPEAAAAILERVEALRDYFGPVDPREQQDLVDLAAALDQLGRHDEAQLRREQAARLRSPAHT
jgi:tetratricopeptide (TPR) repeat protein